VGLPEDVSAVTGDALVVWVGDLGVRERWMLGHEDEEDDGCGEDVYLLALVRCLEVDLGRHVVQRSQLGMEVALAVLSVGWCSEPKVSNFYVEIFVKQKILWLQVSVSNLFAVAVIKTLHELFEEVSGLSLRERARVGDEVEQFTTLGIFENNIGDHPIVSIGFLVERGVEFNLLNDVLVLQFGHGLHFNHDELLQLLI